MKVSLGLPQAGRVSREDVEEFATAVEAAGGYRLWTHHRLLYPVRQEGAHPSLSSDPDDEWPEAFRSVHDPVVTLTVAACSTVSIQLGIGVVNSLFYSPVVAAKMLASLDVFSSGRLAVGLGVGWSPEELEAVGVPPNERRERFSEWIDILRSCWTEEVVSHRGTYYNVPPSIVAPKPYESHLPELLGAGLHQSTVRGAVEEVGSYIAPSVTTQRLSVLLEEMPDETRSSVVGRLPVGVHVPVPSDAAPPEIAESVAAQLDTYRQLGIGELIVDFNFWPELQRRTRAWDFAREIAIQVLTDAA